MTNAMFATPIAEQQPQHERDRCRRRRPGPRSSAERDVGGDDQPALAERGGDQAQHEAADQAAEADRRLHERVRAAVRVARCRRDLLGEDEARDREDAQRELAGRALEGVRQQDGLVAQERPAGLEVVDRRSGGPSVARRRRLGRRLVGLGRAAPPTPGGPAAARRSSPAGPPRRGRSRRRTRTRARSDDCEEHHEQAGDRVVDDVRQRLAHPHRGVRGEQVLLGDDARQDRLRGPAGRRSRSS